MAQQNAIARAQETIGKHEAKIETLTRKRENLLEKIKKLGRSDMSTSLLLTEQVRMIDQERNEIMEKIKILRNTCRQADKIETIVTTQQHLDDLNLLMVQSMAGLGLERVQGINKASDKIADDVKTFEMYTSLDQDKEEKENEESKRYLEELLGSLDSTPLTTATTTTTTKVPSSLGQKQSHLSNLDDLMAMLK